MTKILAWGSMRRVGMATASRLGGLDWVLAVILITTSYQRMPFKEAGADSSTWVPVTHTKGQNSYKLGVEFSSKGTRQPWDLCSCELSSTSLWKESSFWWLYGEDFEGTKSRVGRYPAGKDTVNARNAYMVVSCHGGWIQTEIKELIIHWEKLKKKKNF